MIKGQPRQSSPHGVEQSPVIFQPQQLVGRRHVVCDGFLPIEEEGVRSPDLTGQEIIQGKHLHWAFEAESLIFPALAEEHVYGVFLQKDTLSVHTASVDWGRKGPQLFVYVLTELKNNK